MKIVGKGATDCTEEKGINVAQDILTANPDLKAIYAACGPPIREPSNRSPMRTLRTTK